MRSTPDFKAFTCLESTDCTGACNVIVGAALQGAEVRVSGLFTADNRVLGNWIGVSEQKGRKPTLFSNKGLGVSVDDGATRTVIGAPRASKSIICDGGCNLVGEHMGHGIQVIGGISATDSTLIQGNFLGVTPRADGALPNGQDRFDSALLLYAIGPTIVSTIIGGISTGHVGELCDGACNLISGNGFHGIHVFGTQVFNTTVQGNFIGADPMGLKSIAGNAGAGIVASMGVPGATIGIGAEAEVNPGLGCTGACNVIAGNGGAGVQVEDNSVGISIRGNDIRGNGRLGIDLVANDRPLGDGVTPNDAGDRDTGPNQLINFPAGINYESRNGHTVITGVVWGNPDDLTHDIVDLYAIAKSELDKSGFGGGAYYLGPASLEPTTGFFYLDYPFPLPVDRPLVSGTVTLWPSGSTSEFSAVCGSLANAPDFDGDGLCDDWEMDGPPGVRGLDFDGDGVSDLDLFGAGATIGPKDLFVEIDYMDCKNGGCANGDTHNHRPTTDAVTALKNAYIAGNQASGGQVSVVFHPEIDDNDTIAETRQILIGEGRHPNFWDVRLGLAPGANGVLGCGVAPGNGHFGTQDDRSDPNCPARLGARDLAFKYVLMAHDFDLSDPNRWSKRPSGTSDGGRNSIITLGRMFDVQGNPISNADPATVAQAWAARGGEPLVESGTIMHELGHNFYLGHGGPVRDNFIGYYADIVDHDPNGKGVTPDEQLDHQAVWMNLKPSYLSVMNYLYQISWFDDNQQPLFPNRPLDYSQWKLDRLSEPALKKDDGIYGQGGAAMWPGIGEWAKVCFASPDHLPPAAPTCHLVCPSITSMTPGIAWDGTLSSIGIVSAGIHFASRDDLAAGTCQTATLQSSPKLENLENTGSDWDALRFIYWRAKEFGSPGADLRASQNESDPIGDGSKPLAGSVR